MAIGSDNTCDQIYPQNAKKINWVSGKEAVSLGKKFPHSLEGASLSRRG